MNKQCLAMGLALLVAASRLNAVETNQSRVVLVRDSQAVNGLDVDGERVRAMVAAGIKASTRQNDLAAAWRSLVAPSDVVGIKVNTQAAPLHVSHPAVIAAIADGLAAAGVAATNIVVWDRDPVKLRAAGYRPDDGQPGRPRFRLASVIGESGWDARQFYESPLVGKLIWGDLCFGQADQTISTRSHLPRLLTQTITKLINVPVLQDADAGGLAGCLYNLSLAMVDNTRRFEGPGQHGGTDIAAICALPEVRRKLVWNVMDGLVGGYAGGPAFKPEYSWPCATLYFSRDPVAIDSLAVGLLETRRRARNIPPIANRAASINAAAQLGLGQATGAAAELIETGAPAPQP